MKTISFVLFVFALAFNAAYAEPVTNIGEKHPALHEAQRLVAEAYNKISVAQKSNNYDMKGNASKAKELLEQVNLELKAAADAANQAESKAKKK